MSGAKNKKSLLVSKQLSNSSDKIIDMIHNITGEDISVLKQMSQEELLSYLGFLTAATNLTQKKLYRNFNQNSETFLYHSVRFVEQTHIDESKHHVGKKNKSFGFKKDLHEWIKILFAKRGDFNMKRTFNMNSTSYVTNVDCAHAYIDKDSMNRTCVGRNMSAVNDNMSALGK